MKKPRCLKATIDRWTYSLQSGEPYEMEYRLKRHDGVYLWHLGRANPIRDKEGNIELWVGTNTNIHKQKEAINYIKPFLFSIMQNLISNSVKYSRDDVPLKIEISSKKEGEDTVPQVRDNGIGIDMEKYGRHIFSPFGRTGTKDINGTGIGLYLLKNIIEKNQGYVKAESTPGEGTAFYCYLKEY